MLNFPERVYNYFSPPPTPNTELIDKDATREKVKAVALAVLAVTLSVVSIGLLVHFYAFLPSFWSSEANLIYATPLFPLFLLLPVDICYARADAYQKENVQGTFRSSIYTDKFEDTLKKLAYYNYITPKRETALRELHNSLIQERSEHQTLRYSSANRSPFHPDHIAIQARMAKLEASIRDKYSALNKQSF